MSVKLLERKAIAVEPDMDVLESETLKRAEAVLSYKTAKIMREERSFRSRIAKVLDALKIQPFTNESVDRYQRKVQRRENYKILIPWMLSQALIVLAARNELYANTGWHFGLLVASILVFGLIGNCFMWGDGCIWTTRRQWRSVRIADFYGEIPTFVLMSAVGLKEGFHKEFSWSDNIALNVEYFATRAHIREEERQRMLQRSADPFLVILTEREKIYVEVWEEPGFERPRVK